jgi:hypothetical protein
MAPAKVLFWLSVTALCALSRALQERARCARKLPAQVPRHCRATAAPHRAALAWGFARRL